MKTIYEELSEERKSLQDVGLLPDWFTTAGWQLLSSKYTTETEKDYKAVVERICKCAASWTDDPEHWEKKFFDIIWKGWYSCATPVLANMGTTRGCNVSCSGGVVPDSVSGFYESQKETAVLSKNGFGTSSYLGQVRPRGSIVSSGGKASGILPVLKDFVQLSRDISQGNCYHPSVEVLTEKGFMPFSVAMTQNIKVMQVSQDGHIGFIEPEWVEQDYSGDMIRFHGKDLDIMVTPNHRMYYRPTLKTDKFSVAEAQDLSENYIMFKSIKTKWDFKIINIVDEMIKSAEIVIANFGWTKKNVIYNMPRLNWKFPQYICMDKTKVDVLQAISALCGVNCVVKNINEGDFNAYSIDYHEDTHITSDNISKESVPYEGKVYCAVVPYGGLIVRSNGHTLISGNTRRGAWAGYIEIDHPDFWEIVNFISANPDDCNIGWVVSDKFIERLNAGDKVAISQYQRAMKIKMVTGKGYFFFVDKVNRMNPDCYKDKDLTVKASNLCVTGDTIVEVKVGGDDTIYKLPIGIIGTFISNDVPLVTKSYNTQTNEIEWKRVLNFGLTKKRAELVRVIDVNSSKYITCTPCHLVCTNRGYIEASKLQANDILLISEQNGLVSDNKPFNMDELLNIIQAAGISISEMPKTIVDVLDYVEDVFDITVEDNHNFYANGILVHNCAEIALFSDEEHTFTCVLSSLNLAKYDEWRDTDAIFTATVFLDCVVSEFIHRGKQIPGLERAIRFTEKGRALGLGVMGFHTYLQQKMLSFGSMEAHFENINIFKHIREEAERATKWMAEKWGEPEWCKGYNRRNTHLLCCPPTLSTSSIIGGVSQGIEPIYKNVYVQGSAAGELNRINPVLLNLMKDRDIYDEEHVNEIINNNGSVQKVNWLSDDEKNVFKTAFEIDQKVILRLASTRQKFIDQAQSINLFFSADESEEYISEVHQQAFTDPMIKSLYYIRSEAGVQASKGECEGCSG